MGRGRTTQATASNAVPSLHARPDAVLGGRDMEDSEPVGQIDWCLTHKYVVDGDPITL